MSPRVRRRLGKIVSPFVITALKLHTAVTGTQRSRVIVHNDHGQILLVRGFIGANWSLPGGGIEKGETPLQAAGRELFEETGIKLDIARLELAGAIEGEHSPVNYVAHIFTVSVKSSELPAEQHNRQEIIDIEWHDPALLPEDLSSIVIPSLRLLSKYHDL